MIRCVLAEDDPFSLRLLRRLLEELPDVEVVGEAATGPEAIALVARFQPDLALLDIDLPGCPGLEVARQLPRSGPRVVFVTAHPDFALEAFDVGALHYLLKPVTRVGLARALSRLYPARAEAWLRLPVRHRGDLAYLRPEGVDALVADLGDCLAWTAEGPQRVEGTLAHWEERLEPHGFLRIHRNALVRLAAVTGLRADGRVVVPSGALDVSRRRLEALQEALASPL